MSNLATALSRQSAVCWPELELDSLILQAAREVDQTLLDWSLHLSPRERLRGCSKAGMALGKFRRGSSRTG